MSISIKLTKAEPAPTEGPYTTYTKRHDETASNAMHLEKIKNSTSDKRLHEEQDMGKGASENPKVLQHRHHCVR